MTGVCFQMIIEIRRAGFGNKGAALMLHAVLHKIREFFPDAQFAMDASYTAAPYQKRAALGLFQKASFWRYHIQWGQAAGLVPKRIRRMYGVVLDREIDAVLDAAGFCYTDQWGAERTVELADSSRRWRKNGTKIVLLPQAFGPFSSRRIKDAMRIAADNIDLIFARDCISYKHLIEVVGERPNIRMAPDFTNLIEPFPIGDLDMGDKQFCVVPNSRMIDKTGQEERGAYLSFMIKCVQYLLEKGIKTFILIHDKDGDLILSQEILRGAGCQLPIIQEEHPLKIKGILGACHGLIGSRFHSLVSALSQGVPSVGVGWSHKYQMLFEDYGFSEGLMDVMMDEGQIQKRIDLITEKESRERVQKVILEKSNQMKHLSIQMWNQVIDLLKNV